MVPASSLNLPAVEERQFLRVRLQQMEWSSGWNKILQVGLYQKGPDLSEVGSTWLENLHEMRSLRPFSEAEVRALGGRDAFLATSWPVTTGEERQRLVSIPWTLDTRLICYRRDLLAQAGIEEATAFESPEAVYETLRRLQSAGMRYPLALPTGGLVIHNLASWVWGRGGQFRSDDCRRILLVEPEGRQALFDYFRLHRFIDPAYIGQNYNDTEVHYYEGRAAVLFTGQWAMMTIKDGADPVIQPVHENTGYAMLPGVPWVGAAHLVIWRHSLRENEAIQLINHLTSPEILAKIFEAGGNMPARLVALQDPPFTTDSDLQMVVDGLRRGRAFRTGRLWAGVEVRLNVMHDQLWAALLANPQLDLEREIERRVTDLATRLEKTLLAN
jgi:multiple sugar transport system substrate-binding protein